MVQAYDHRAASIEVDANRTFRPGQPVSSSVAEHADPNWSPMPQSWIDKSQIGPEFSNGWFLAFKDITSSTNMRTMIAAIIPRSGVGDMLPLILSLEDSKFSLIALLSIFNSIICDFVARQKVQANHLKWYSVEQLPVLTASHYDRHFGKSIAADIVRSRLTANVYCP